MTTLATLPGRSSCVDPTFLSALPPALGLQCSLSQSGSRRAGPQDRDGASRHYVPPQEWEAIDKALRIPALAEIKDGRSTMCS